ncbi:phosphoinositide phosphatase SAC2-like [Iris pallida]|uniref:Phosphoinositide phosphatase SAC2-like n=1 Tax=Iris pallida TaxID=29817 RepID=A0AAX6EZK8_IRIPA|nr:phosphoinositide phosphatase SAC2-like [Iris pallida]
MAAEVSSSPEVVGGDGGGGILYLQKFRLYETRSKIYMIGRDKSRTVWRVLKIDSAEPSELDIYEDPTMYTQSECSDLLERLNEGNRSNGGLRFVTKCYGIIGFIKFLGPYYMLLITKRRKIGTICGHTVYSVSKSEMIALPNSSMQPSLAYSKNENRYKKLLCTVDLTKDFFFSYSYHVMYSLQRNACGETGQVPYETMCVWNEYLTREIRSHIKNTMWTVALVYGFFKQVKMSISGKDFTLTLIARRSRHFAGTRYLKRGVNEKGKVANDVETEQIVFEDILGGSPMQISSVVQNRGSIPLYWSQESSWLNIKPDIIVHNNQNYEATRLHFENLVKRYRNPILILNLIKTREKKPRESVLREEFDNAIVFINKNLAAHSRLRFLHWDLHRQFQINGINVFKLLGKVAANALDLTGFFYCQVPPSSRLHHALSWPVLVKDDAGQCSYKNNKTRTSDIMTSGYGPQEDKGENFEVSQCVSPEDDNHLCRQPTIQKGVLRTNCIDCLDRTNVAQYAYGLAALGRQLYALGFINVQNVDLESPLAEELMCLYESMGDTLSLQYGGSTAHTMMFSQWRRQWKAAIQSQKVLTILQRYYSNTYVDAEKQDAINVFLGHFQPHPDKPALWELGSDQHYNMGRRGHAFLDGNMRSLKRSFSDGNIPCEHNTSISNDVGEREPRNSANSYITEEAKGLFFSRTESENGICYFRSSLTNSVVGMLSTEIEINGVTLETSTNPSETSIKGSETAETGHPSGAAEIPDLSEFSKSFVDWVMHEEALCCCI